MADSAPNPTFTLPPPAPVGDPLVSVGITTDTHAFEFFARFRLDICPQGQGPGIFGNPLLWAPAADQLNNSHELFLDSF